MGGERRETIKTRMILQKLQVDLEGKVHGQISRCNFENRIHLKRTHFKRKLFIMLNFE